MRTACATNPAGMGRMDATIFPEKAPAGSQSMWATGTPLSRSACSKVKEQPIRNATVLSVQ